MIDVLTKLAPPVVFGAAFYIIIIAMFVSVIDLWDRTYLCLYQHKYDEAWLCRGVVVLEIIVGIVYGAKLVPFIF